MWLDPDGVPVMVNNGAFPEQFLDEIVNTYKDKMETAKHLDVEDSGKMSTDNKVRNSDVVFFRNPDMQRTLWDIVRSANDMMQYRCEMTGAEDLQFTKYGPNQHYYWHQDMAINSLARRFVPSAEDIPEGHNPLAYIPDPNLIGTVRKMSITLLLNDPKEYKGGEFEVMYIMRGKTIKKKIKGQKGSVFIFPSWMEHRVKPVTKGTRYSVVQWFAGPPWK
tara:strand:- start:286 stop:945 length:660 start_codon:yes stop_codon:yes gene_type:complete